MDFVATIIISTCNRAADLKLALESLGAVHMPADIPTELLVVDNASTDHTAEVVRSSGLTNMPVRYLYEGQPGKSNGLNSAISLAQGKIFLFSDDDVRFPKNWIAEMCGPILSLEAHAVQGGIHIAPHLARPWFTPLLKDSLAHYEGPRDGGPFSLIGANMAISREVFEKVPGFDPEIGPGLSSGGEDTLFSWQMEKAGYRIVSAHNVAVVHHFDETRLSRRKFLNSAWRGGFNSAYLCYHWLHYAHRHPSWLVARAWLRLTYWRIRRWREWRRKDQVASWEVGLVHDLSLHWHYWRIRKKPKHYVKHGLVKLQNGEKAFYQSGYLQKNFKRGFPSCF